MMQLRQNTNRGLLRQGLAHVCVRPETRLFLFSDVAREVSGRHADIANGGGLDALGLGNVQAGEMGLQREGFEAVIAGRYVDEVDGVEAQGPVAGGLGRQSLWAGPRPSMSARRTHLDMPGEVADCTAGEGEDEDAQETGPRPRERLPAAGVRRHPRPPDGRSMA